MTAITAGACGHPCERTFNKASSRSTVDGLMAFVSVFTPSTSLGFAKGIAISHTRHVRSKASGAARRSVLRATADEVKTSAPAVSDSKDNGTGKKEEQEYDAPEVILDENIVGFCSLDPSTGKRLELSVRDKETLFLDAMQAFYRGDVMLSNEEFDSLKEELTWQGSDVVSLNRDEYRFLDAAKAYEQGQPIMEDQEFDKLKKKLFEQGSVVAIQRGPRCSIERKITFSDVIPDKKRTFALFVPAGLLMSLIWLSAAFELTPLHRVDPVISLLLGSPLIFVLARVLTYLVVPQAQIMVGDCPSCGRRTHVLFGNVLNQKGFLTEANVKCEKCKAELKVEKDTSRMILMKEGS